QALFEQSLDPIMVLDGSLSYIDANRAALEFLECRREEFLTKKVWDFTPPSVAGTPRKHFPFAGHETLEMESFVHGQVKTLILNVVPLTFSGKTILYCMGQDITEKRQIAKSLRLSEDKFRFLFDYTSDPTFVYQLLENGQASRLIEVNETLCQELGYSKTELLQMPPDASGNPIHVVELMRMGIDPEMLRNDQLSFETVLIDKHGQKKSAEINSHFFPLSHGTLVLSVVQLGYY
ncbi:MAG: PAS domain-containing protein, partial [Candidatus Hodarchaeales archaeon]